MVQTVWNAADKRWLREKRSKCKAGKWLVDQVGVRGELV